MPVRTIIAAGGLETAQQEIDFARYFAALLKKRSGKARPMFCLLGQAQAENEDLIARERELYEAAGCEFTALQTFKPSELFVDTFARADGFMAVGGSTLNMMAIWQARGLIPLLRAAYEAGKPITGYSAGAMCWFQRSLTSDAGIEAGHQVFDGLGWLSGSFFPHYIKTLPGLSWRPQLAEPMVAQGQLPSGIACDDGVFALFENEILQGFHSIVPGNNAYRITPSGCEVIESQLAV